MTNPIERALDEVQQQAKARNIKIPELYEGDLNEEMQDKIQLFTSLINPTNADFVVRGVLAIQEELLHVSAEYRDRCTSKFANNLRGSPDERFVLNNIAEFQEAIRKSANQAKHPLAFLWSWLR